MQRKLLLEDRRFGAIPLLQAVVVCLKVSATSSVNTSAIPKVKNFNSYVYSLFSLNVSFFQPTAIRDSPGSFGDLGCEHYLNPLLAAKLDNKLKAFMNIPKKLDLPYRSILKPVSVGKNHERAMLRDLAEVDRNNTAHFIYGKPPWPLITTAAPSGDHLPRILTSHPAAPVYLHRTGFKTQVGVLQLEVEEGEARVTTFAYFELARYKFFTEADYFATDLVNIMKIPSPDRIHVHAMLAYPGTLVPYLALAGELKYHNSSLILIAAVMISNTSSSVERGPEAGAARQRAHGLQARRGLRQEDAGRGHQAGQRVRRLPRWYDWAQNCAGEDEEGEE